MEALAAEAHVIPTTPFMPIEPITAALTAGQTAKNLLGGIVDRWRGVHESAMDERAMVRLLVLECRRNLAVLDVAVGRAEPLSERALWLVPAVLQTDALEAVLGQGKAASGAFRLLLNAKASVELTDGEAKGLLANVYVRLTALKSLVAINEQTSLSRVRIKVRLTALREDIRTIVATLSGHASARSAAV